jgi:polysaccharide export outer membrane protein
MEAGESGRYSLKMTLVSRLFQALSATFALVGAATAMESPQPASPSPPQASQKVQLGVGDQVRIEFFGLDNFTTTTTVAEDGSVRLPLTGPVKIIGQTPPDAAKIIEDAFRDGLYLTNPHVTVNVLQSSSQRVSVLGEVRNPNRYPIETNTTVLDLIALAGGATEKSCTAVQILRGDSSGKQQTLTVDTDEFASAAGAGHGAVVRVQGGDVIRVPKCTFRITGEVRQTGEFRIEKGMTVTEAIAIAGGTTPMGSANRVVIQRRNASGRLVELKGKKDMRVEPDDIIRVKERLL